MDIFDKLMRLPVLRIFEPFYKKNKEVLLYLLFGGLTTVISIAVYWIFVTPLSVSELIANIVSWIAAVSFAYVTNRTWVFSQKASGKKAILVEMASFFAARLVTLGVEEAIIYVFITRLGYNKMIVKITAQIIVIVANYVFSKLFVFRKRG